MIPLTSFAGKKVAVFGLGASGRASAEALVAGGAEVTVWDDQAASRDKAAAQGLPLVDLSATDLKGFDSLLLAPGVPLTHPQPHWIVTKAREAGIEIIGDIELFCRERRAIAPKSPFVAITGTNGKSTTTALIAHLFATFGYRVEVGGNIGTPILALSPPSPEIVHVIECSSFQIDLAPSLDPWVGVLLNVTPDHLDRHGTMENYAAIKERLVAKADIAVIAIDDQSIANIGRWPWPRDIQARMIDILAAAHAKVIVNTTFFFEHQVDPGLAHINKLLELYEKSVGQSPVDAAAPASAAAAPVPELAQFGVLLREAEQALNTDRRLAASLDHAGNVLLPMVFRTLAEPHGNPDKPLPAYVMANGLAFSLRGVSRRWSASSVSNACCSCRLTCSPFR